MSSITWDTSRVLQNFVYGAITLFDGRFQVLPLFFHNPISRSRNPTDASIDGLGCFPFARRYLGNQCLFIFLGLLRCFTSPGLASGTYVFSARLCGITRIGLPHSEISGSKSACNSPERIAACRVLHRLLVPSHPHVSS